MKVLAAFSVLAVILQVALCLPLSSEHEVEVIERSKRQGANYWNCDETVNGCNITFCCQAIPELDLDTLVCHLNGRKINCASLRPPHIPAPYKLYFWIDANLATVNTPLNHRMVISVRGSVSGSIVSLPWIFRFRGDPYYCPTNVTPTPPPTGGMTTTEVTRVTTTMTLNPRSTSTAMLTTTTVIRPTSTVVPTTMTIPGPKTTVTQHVTTTIVPTSTTVSQQTISTQQPRPTVTTAPPTSATSPSTTAQTPTEPPSTGPTGSTEPYLVEMAKGEAVVDAVLEKLNSSGWETNTTILQFLRRIAIAESNFGNDSNTFRPGYYGGIWQVDRAKFDATKTLGTSTQLVIQIVQVINRLGIDWFSVPWDDLRKPLYSAIAVCLFLSNVTEPIPVSLEGQANFWYKYYHKNNTKSIVDFLNRVHNQEDTEPTETIEPTETPTVNSPPLPTCNAGRDENTNNLVIFCASSYTIANIVCQVNGRFESCLYDSGTVTIEDDLLRNGRNIIQLTVYYSNGRFNRLSMTYDVDRSTPTPAPTVARVECTARFIQNTGLEITCIINRDVTGAGITSILYNVNNQGNVTAIGIPKFTVPIRSLTNGLNKVSVYIRHNIYGSAAVHLNVSLDIRPLPLPPCRVSCTYRGVVGGVQFECSVTEGDGSLSSVGYSVNRFSASNLPALFQIPISHFVIGNNSVSLTFVVVCNGQLETLQYQLIIPVSPPSQSNFRISNIRATTSTSGLSGSRISYTVRGNELSFSVTIGGEVVSSYTYTLNSGSSQSTSDSEVTLDKDILVEGQNTLVLAVYYRNGSSVANFNITFNVQK